MENGRENDDLNPSARHGIERLPLGCAPEIPDQALTEICRYIDDKTVITLLANQEAFALLFTAEAIIEKLFRNG